MSDPLRNLFDKVKPTFQGSGKLAKYFPLFDVFENLFYSSDRKTSGLTHIRDGSDIQRIMVVVWLATFPAAFFGMYNVGFQALSACRTHLLILVIGFKLYLAAKSTISP